MTFLLKKLKSSLFLSLVVICYIFSRSVEVNAETTEDLFRIYGTDLGGVSKPSIDNSVKEVESALEEAERKNKEAAWVNSAIESAKLQYDSKIENVNKRVSSTLSTNMDIKYTIEQNIYGDVNVLLSNDSVYKSNFKKANQILSELDGYGRIDYMTQEEIDISGIMSKYNEVISQYEVAVDVYEMGEVTNVKFPMDREKYITSEFGNRVDPLNPSTTRYHSGLDLRAEVGTPVKVLFDGVVSECGWSETVGYFVRVEHGDNVRTFYCHLSELLCEKGQSVSQYGVIAKSGATGSRCTGPHLHLGVYINGSAVNPDLLFK